MSTSWTQDMVDRKLEAGNIQSWKEKDKIVTKGAKTGKKKRKNENKVPKPPPAALLEMHQVLHDQGVPFVTEHKFHPVRRFRFDIALPDKMLAIEYEGVMSSKSRHTTVTGYSKDATKYNLAQLAGWTVLRYTVMNYKDFENDIKQYL